MFAERETIFYHYPKDYQGDKTSGYSKCYVWCIKSIQASYSGYPDYTRIKMFKKEMIQLIRKRIYNIS